MNDIMKRLAAASAARLAAEDAVLKEIETAIEELCTAGWSRDYASVFNSLYIRKGETTIRIADHRLPSCISASEFRAWQAGPEVIYGRLETPTDVRARIFHAVESVN